MAIPINELNNCLKLLHPITTIREVNWANLKGKEGMKLMHL